MKGYNNVVMLVLRYLSAILLLIFSDFLYKALQPLTFYSAYYLTSLFADARLLSSTELIVGTQTLEFVPACAAVLAYILLYILILFTRGISFRLGLKIALVGSVIIFVVNIIRIEALMYVLLKYGKDYFQTLHLLVWKVFSSLFVALLWILFVRKYKIKGIPIYDDLKSFARKR